MGFEIWKAEQYRSSDAEQLTKRKAEIVAELENPESEVDTEQLRSECAMLKAEYARREQLAQVRSLAMTEVNAGNAKKVATLKADDKRDVGEQLEGPTETVEYRRAFMDYVMTGKRSAALSDAMQSRGNESTLTTDLGVLIPANLVNDILEKAETEGMILPLVTKTNFPVGQTIPVGSIKPVATWVAEGATSDRQKQTGITSIVFSHHKLRCEVSISMEAHVMSLSVFETRLVAAVAKAIVRAKEQAILTGSGTGQPKGIMAETPVEGQAITVKAGELAYKTIVDCEAAIPQAYEAGAKWFMSKKSFMSFVGITDADGQPIARVNYGIGGKPERYLLGREVVLTGDYLPSYDPASSDDVKFAFIFDMSDYVLNSNYDMGVQKKQDWDTEDLLTKAVTACDGKAIDLNSLVTLTMAKAGK